MKQHITKEQWDELSLEQKDILVAKYGEKANNQLKHPPKNTRGTQRDNIWLGGYGESYKIEALTIGQMIEFLGDDLKIIENDKPHNTIRVRYKAHNLPLMEISEELVDALWIACKNKLKN